MTDAVANALLQTLNRIADALEGISAGLQDIDERLDTEGRCIVESIDKVAHK